MTRTLITPHLFKTENANIPDERSFQGLFKTCNLSLLSIPETEQIALKRPEPLLESYTGKTYKSEILLNHTFSFF